MILPCALNSNGGFKRRYYYFCFLFRNKTKTITVVCAPQSFPRMIYIHIDNCRDLAVSKGTVHTFMILICMRSLRLTASNCNCLLFAEQSVKCSFPVRSKCRWSVQTASSWSWEPIHRLGELSSFGYVEHTVLIKRMLVFWISVSIEYSKTEQLNKLLCTNNWISFVYVDFIYIYTQWYLG